MTVLYNHRTAVFLMMYLKDKFQVLPSDFVAFIISKIREMPESLPALKGSIDFLDNQAQLMVDGVSSMSELPDTNGLVFLPHMGSAILVAKEADKFYIEMTALTKEYCKLKGLPVDEETLDEVIEYQKLRFPSWPVRDRREYEFKTNIPEYFECLTNGYDVPAIEKKTVPLTVKDLRRDTQTFPEFAATLVRGGLTVDLLEVNLPNFQRPADKEKLYRIRRDMEQRSIDKLKSEFGRLKSSAGA